jgi:DNA-binding protein HU-beta
MNKGDLIDAVAKATGLTKAAAGEAVDAVFANISDTLKAGKDVRLLGFGTFSLSKRPARTGLNPRTKQPITIKAGTVARFKAGAQLKAAVNG